MTKFVCLAAALLALSGCADSKTICGVEYESYGLINRDDKRAENIKYEIVTGNVIWSVVLFETTIAPLYFIGFSLYQPVSATGRCAS